MRHIPESWGKLAHLVAKLLVMIFEKSRWSGEVPRDWKKSKIAPIFKKHRKGDLGNYQTHFSAWEDHEEGSPGRYDEAYGRARGDME